MTVPYVFATQPAGEVPAAYLDDNFTAIVAAAAVFPASFGATPTNYQSINHGSYPTAGMIAEGVLQQYVAAMKIPSTAPIYSPAWPHNNFAAYLDNQGNSGQSGVNYFSIATLTGSDGYAANYNGIVSNASWETNNSGATGLGNNFGQLVSYEVNANIFKVGASAPTGAFDGIRFIGGGENTRPTGGAFGIHFFPLAGYNGATDGTYWTTLIYSEDSSASTPANASYFADIGSSSFVANSASQPIRMRARDSGAVGVSGYLQYNGSGNFYMNSKMFIGATTGATDTDAIFQTYSSANSLQIANVIRNDNGSSPTAALGFNVASSGSGDTSVSKAGIGFTRTAAQGTGYLSIFNRSTTDTAAFTTSDERVRVTSTSMLLFGDFELSGYIQGGEQTPPSAPAANGYRIFAQDNGAGKTQLMAIFSSGAAQQIAIQP